MEPDAVAADGLAGFFHGVHFELPDHVVAGSQADHAQGVVGSQAHHFVDHDQEGGVAAGGDQRRVVLGGHGHQVAQVVLVARFEPVAGDPLLLQALLQGAALLRGPALAGAGIEEDRDFFHHSAPSSRSTAAARSTWSATKRT